MEKLNINFFSGNLFFHSILNIIGKNKIQRKVVIFDAGGLIIVNVNYRHVN